MIGIFDSGVGGMTVARAIEQSLPDRTILYLGDIARSPYGSKSSEAIRQYSVENATFLVEHGAKVIVIACNSASSVATEELRKRFDIPVIEVISPAVRMALHASRTGRIGVIGTRATISSNIYEQKILAENPDAKVTSLACPLLVPLVEEGWSDKRETKMILRRYLHPLKNSQIDTLVLGCTHYPLLTSLIQHRIGKKVRIIDSSQATAHYLAEYLQQNEIMTDQSRSQNRYFVTDLPRTAEKIAEKIFGRPVTLERGDSA